MLVCRSFNDELSVSSVNETFGGVSAEGCLRMFSFYTNEPFKREEGVRMLKTRLRLSTHS